MLTNEDLKRKRAAAEACSGCYSIPWMYSGTAQAVLDDDGDAVTSRTGRSTGAHIAENDPASVLEMVDHIEAQAREIERLDTIHDSWLECFNASEVFHARLERDGHRETSFVDMAQEGGASPEAIRLVLGWGDE